MTAKRTARVAASAVLMLTRALALLLLLSACAARSSRSGGPDPATATGVRATATRPNVVRMLLVNDVYVLDTLRDGSGGLPRVAFIRDSIERITGAPVLFVLAGDVLSPSVLGKWSLGAHMVQGFNAARLDYATLGNHEFDGSRAALLARVSESRFRWMSGNCGETSGAAFAGVRGWDTLRVNGIRVGLFGTTIVREYPAYVKCANADVATTGLVDTLQRAGAELIVGITHRNMFEDTTTLVREPRITAILGGHDHNGRRFVRDGRVMVKAVSNSRTAILVTFTRRGAVWDVQDTSIRIGRGMRDEPKTRAVVQAWRDTLLRRIGPDRVLGIAPEPINAIDSVSRHESRFGNMIADGVRMGTGVDVGLVNSGALRFDDMLAAGPITRHMIEGIFLFADETRVVQFTLTGARLRELLEHGVQRGSLDNGPYPQVSGVRFRFDPRLANGARVVGDLTRDDGRVLAPTDSVRVGFGAYPSCRGGDGYRIPEAAAACKAYDANPSASPRTVDLVLQHLEAMKGRIIAPPTGRATRLDR